MLICCALPAQIKVVCSFQNRRQKKMAVDRLYNAFWDESFWFPPNRTHCWNDLVNEPGSDIYMPDIKHLHWSIVLGVLLIGVRYLIEM